MREKVEIFEGSQNGSEHDQEHSDKSIIMSR